MGSDWAMHADRDNEFRRLRAEIEALRAKYDEMGVLFAEARAELASNKLVIDQLAHERNDTQAALEEATARAERAETERDAMRDRLRWALHELREHQADYHHITPPGDIDKASASLGPSPAGRRFTGLGELEKSGYTAPSPAGREG